MGSASYSGPGFSRLEKGCLAALTAILAIFTWRTLITFYSGDDMMNLYVAWDSDLGQLVESQLLPWIPVYRPVGGAVYRLLYGAFGFHPAPFYFLSWVLLLVNVPVAYLFLREVSPGVMVALTALSLTLVHGNFQDLYLNGGTIYDRLVYLFSMAALAAYFRFRKKASPLLFAAICVFTILAMGSKESGVTVVAVMACCEALFFLPRTLKGQEWRRWLAQTARLYAVLAVLSVSFVLGRVRGSPSMAANPMYTPHADIGVWLTRLAWYFGLLSYKTITFTPPGVAILLLIMAVIAMAVRSRAMALGWLFFVISITPVALITARAAYVLYLPWIGLGLYFAAALALITAPLARIAPATGLVVFAIVTLGLSWIHIRHWPAPWAEDPEERFTRQFRREYPKMPPKSRLLFVSDDFPVEAFDLHFNTRLLYHEKSIEVYRTMGPPDQRPTPGDVRYDHIFAYENEHYSELDLRDPAESIRLHILRDFPVGSEMDMGRRDHSAYVISGLLDGAGNDGTRWTSPEAKFKFKPGPDPKAFTAKYYVPDFVAAPPTRSLSVIVNGKELGTVPLHESGIKEISLPVPPGLVHADGYTFVDMNVSNAYKDPSGMPFGVVLLRAGFVR